MKIRSNSGQMGALEQNIRNVGREFVESWVPPSTISMPKSIADLILDASIAMPMLRTSVVRNRYNKSEVEIPVEAQEDPTRIYNTISKMAKVAYTLDGTTDDIVRKMILKMMFDGIPDIRQRVLRTMYKHRKTIKTRSAVSKLLRVSEAACGRHIADLEILDIIDKQRFCDIKVPVLEEALKEFA